MMSESRSRLVRVVAEREYDRWQTNNFRAKVGRAALGRLIPWADLSERERQPFYDRAEVAVAAVLDELSEGPLHDAMFGAAWEDFCVVDPVPVVTEADPFTLLFWRGKVRGAVNTALSVARTWNEEE